MLPVIDHTKPIVIYSDGGPDHHVTCGSVQLSFKNVFLQGDFDMIVAVRTPPVIARKTLRKIGLDNFGISSPIFL